MIYHGSLLLIPGFSSAGLPLPTSAIAVDWELNVSCRRRVPLVHGHCWVVRLPGVFISDRGVNGLSGVIITTLCVNSAIPSVQNKRMISDSLPRRALVMDMKPHATKQRHIQTVDVANQ